MSKQEIEQLLLEAVNKLNMLEASYHAEIDELKDRMQYLEEVISSQQLMLKDSAEYIKKIESYERED